MEYQTFCQKLYKHVINLIIHQFFEENLKPDGPNPFEHYDKLGYYLLVEDKAFKKQFQETFGLNVADIVLLNFMAAYESVMLEPELLDIVAYNELPTEIKK